MRRGCTALGICLILMIFLIGRIGRRVVAVRKKVTRDDLLVIVMFIILAAIFAWIMYGVVCGWDTTTSMCHLVDGQCVWGGGSQW